MPALLLALMLAASLGCSTRGRPDGGLEGDGAIGIDAASPNDAAATDGSRGDASASDAGSASDARTSDAHAASDAFTASDASHGDANANDANVTDAFAHDASTTIDAGSTPDAGSTHDAASGRCVSGAPGTIAVRFRWIGNGPGSTAYVSYEANELPDTSRWHVSAASMSFGYTPVYDDTFLGEGGLDLNGTAFIDVELSTAGTSISSATIAIYGRSFDTTTNGSFSWQTFSGTNAAPTDLVSNVAPYQWYLADATSELPAGDGNTLLRIYPGPSSNDLIVDRVEICFAP
jgi:hypothetical protein